MYLLIPLMRTCGTRVPLGERMFMKIIHTSDWHIGREFENESLAETQMQFVAWLAGEVRARQVDLVIVAGDVWDRAVPRGEAVTLLDDALNELRAAGAQIIMISGNHDSAPRLNWGASRQRESGVFIFAEDEEFPTPFVFEREGERVAIVAVPFLDPQRAPQPIEGEEGTPRLRTHQNVLEDALFVGRGRLTGLDDMPSVAVAHAYVQGSSISDSERHTVGGSDVVDAAVFEGFDYVALGHLHRPQEIGGNPAIAYSGSPIPYSFSEDHQKSVRLVEIDETGFIGATTIPIPVGRPVKVLTDSMSNLLECPEYGAFVGHWISAKLTDELAQVEPMRRLRDRFPHVASVSYDNTRRSGAVGPDDGSVDIATRHPSEVVRDFVADLQGRVVTSAEDELIVQGLALLAERADG